jgi:hypothetical protein
MTTYFQVFVGFQEQHDKVYQSLNSYSNIKLPLVNHYKSYTKGISI